MPHQRALGGNTSAQRYRRRVNAAPVAGALLDARYRVGSPIATGGMSTVYRGVDTRLDRPVAVKIMDARFADDPAFRTRFEREARSAARIDHPAVVDVYDQGTDDDQLFLVMELVDGGTLRDVLRTRGALGVPAAFAVMEQVLAGLAEAHRLGMVHRDVKPENVLISEAREAKVADFGLAVAVAQAGASHAGTILGTVAYLSPEQVAVGAADPRSDVYAAGIMLYELLTGTPPYTGDTAISVAYRHVNCDVPVPSEVAGDVPPELDAFVQRATRRDPTARPADAAAMSAELRRLAVLLEVPHVPMPAPPPRPLEEQTTAPRPARAAARNGTRMLERDVHPSVPPPPLDHRRARRRSRRLFALWTAVVLVLAMGIGTTSWWLGSGRWTAVPSLAGVQRDAAERLLTGADLVPVARLVYVDDVPAGVVTATEPATSTPLLRGSTVTLVVSRGLPTVPAIAPGTSVDDAEAAIRAAQLTPAQSGSEYNSSVPKGAVVRTRPAAGTAVSPGSRVSLVVSRGGQEDQQVRVPFLIGKRFDEAETILNDLGLDAEEQSQFGRDDGRVVDQSNGAGSLVDRGTTIVLKTF
ncbi:MAG: Stk1 family PASTA domain-containing Ser/Thr kinase [Pseudonocardia sp.]|nr:Stk1 family PASTA domain-containing Ser/Thr kinase [Pseudonocardia sp.]